MIRKRLLPQDLVTSWTQLFQRSQKSSSIKVAKEKIKPVPSLVDNFRTLRLGGRNFIDKSNFIRKLIDGSPSVYLFTRPKRFGKTTFVTMLEDFLEGRKELFNETNIQSRGNNIIEDETWQKYPVIKIDFYGMCKGWKVEDFINELQSELKRIADEHELTSTTKFWTIDALIDEMNPKYKLPVCVLIDNYDDPFMVPYTSENKNALLMDELVQFYSAIKACVSKLRLVFITGVSRINKVYLAWNGFVDDFTHTDEYWSMLGFTWEEAEFNFDPNIAKFASNKGAAKKDVQNELKLFYGFYRFTEKENHGLMIPGSPCQCLGEEKLNVYMPSNLAFVDVVNQMKARNITVDEFKFKEIPANYLDSNFLLTKANEIPLAIHMFCNGFLTIKDGF